MAKSLQARLREARKDRGLTQADVAEIFDVSVATVSNWENGHEPREAMRARLEDWLMNEASTNHAPANPQLQNVTPAFPNEDQTDSSGDEDDPDPFSEWLRTSREKKGLSRRGLATKANVSAQTIYLIETGRVSNPWEATKTQLIDALGVKPPKAMDDELKAETDTVFGRFRDFGPWDESTIPSIACVYVYYDQADRPVYIGETVNLRTRNRQHQENDKWYIRRLIDRGSYVETRSREQRKGLEILLIQFLRRNTLFNRKHTKPSE